MIDDIIVFFIQGRGEPPATRHERRLRLAIAVGLAYGAYHLSVPPPNPYADYGGSW